MGGKCGKEKRCGERIVGMNEGINVVYVGSVDWSGWILERICVVLKEKGDMYVMGGGRFVNGGC